MKKRTNKITNDKIRKPKALVFTKIAKWKKSLVARDIDVEYQIKLKDRSKKIDESWDFRKSNTKEYTHCFHSYPAMMIPQVARRIIDNFGNKSAVISESDRYRICGKYFQMKMSIETIVKYISNKRMPLKNSPSNVLRMAV